MQIYAIVYISSKKDDFTRVKHVHLCAESVYSNRISIKLNMSEVASDYQKSSDYMDCDNLEYMIMYIV